MIENMGFVLILSRERVVTLERTKEKTNILSVGTGKPDNKYVMDYLFDHQYCVFSGTLTCNLVLCCLSRLLGVEFLEII